MKMKKSVLVLMSVLLLTGCGAAVSESVQTDSDNINISRSDIELAGENRMESDEEYLPETQNDLTAEESLEVTPELSLTETSVIPPESMSEAESSIALENVSETDIKPWNFDAAEAMEVEQIDEGIKVVFYQFPETIEDMEALIALYPQTDPRNVGAYFLAALVKYVDSSESGLSMIDLLRGPRPMTEMDKSFLKDRLREKGYLPGAYFEGAAPENDYTPDEPWTLIVYDDPMQAEDGYIYICVATTGADSRRRITLREKEGQYYLWEYSNVLTGIRLPASEDPWAS